jgi:hypothetical protein
LVAATGFVTFSHGGGNVGSSHAPAVASRGDVSAFVDRAERALDGEFSATYTVAPGFGSKGGSAQVQAAQLNSSRTVYREIPPLGRTSHSQSYEVFTGSRADPDGVFSCTLAGGARRWTCFGPYVGLGMTAMHALTDPYPPQELALGLQNAVATYAAPVFLSRRTLAGRTVHCLEFGAVQHPIGSVCLNRAGVIAFYDLPQSASDTIYTTATLQHYSTHLSPGALTLPGTPRSADVFPPAQDRGRTP